MESDIKKRVIQNLMSKDILVTEDVLSKIEILSNVTDTNLIYEIENNCSLIFDDDFFKLLEKNIESEKAKENRGNVEIVINHELKPRKRHVRDFISLFRKRYNALSTVLQSRQELQGVTSIMRLKHKSENESVALIGMISEIGTTKKGNVLMTLEDDTGTIKVVVTSRNDNFDRVKDLSLDEMIGVTGTMGTGIIFANTVVLPDIPITKELKKSPNDEYALFISDLHFGSTYFLHKQWNKFFKWLNGDVGSDDHKNIVKKIKYLFIVGDLVDGVGIYPGQDNDLDIVDIFDQYAEFTKWLKKIPSHMQIIICPGNHDAVRIAEPQPAIPAKYVPELYEMDNVHMVSNPALVNIGKTDSFTGLDILMYHGYSLIYYADNVPSIRDAGGLNRTDLILKYLLQRRHLSPSYKSNQFVPEASCDPLFMNKIPDVVATGHIHMVTASNYRNISIINSSSWIGMTDFQEKMGLEPHPARAVLMSLKTRSLKVLNFNDNDSEVADPKN